MCKEEYLYEGYHIVSRVLVNLVDGNTCLAQLEGVNNESDFL
jgi:hypothetical protein